MIPTRMGDMMWRFDLRMILTGREAQREVVIQVEVGAMGCRRGQSCRHPAFCVELSKPILKEQKHPSSGL
jgi:hypothetical protein